MDASAEEVTSLDERRRIRLQAFREAEVQCTIIEQQKRKPQRSTHVENVPVCGQRYLEMKAKKKIKEDKICKILYIAISVFVAGLAGLVALRELGYF
jgi:hypothetical protein